MNEVGATLENRVRRRQKMGSFRPQKICFHGVGCYEMGSFDGFERSPKPFEILDGATAMALGLGLIAQEQRSAIGFIDHAANPSPRRKFRFWARMISMSPPPPARSELIRIMGSPAESSGFEARCAEKDLLGESDPPDGEEFLRVDGFLDRPGGRL